MNTRNGHNGDEVTVIDHTAIYERVERSEERTATTLKWVGGIIAMVLVAYGGYGANAAGKDAERIAAILVGLAELKATQTALVTQIQTIHDSSREATQTIKEELEEHEHNANAHHSPTGEAMYLPKHPDLIRRK